MAEESLVVCDTNVIIEFYKENQSIVSELHEIGQENIAVSVITSGELLFGALNKEELKQIKNDLAHLHLIQLNSAIGERFVELMSEYTLSHDLSLPDGFIAATALIEGISLYTLNKKHFKYIEGLKLYDQSK